MKTSLLSSRGGSALVWMANLIYVIERSLLATSTISYPYYSSYGSLLNLGNPIKGRVLICILGVRASADKENGMLEIREYLAFVRHLWVVPSLVIGSNATN